MVINNPWCRHDKSFTVFNWLYDTEGNTRDNNFCLTVIACNAYIRHTWLFTKQWRLVFPSLSFDKDFVWALFTKLNGFNALTRILTSEFTYIHIYSFELWVNFTLRLNNSSPPADKILITEKRLIFKKYVLSCQMILTKIDDLRIWSRLYAKWLYWRVGLNNDVYFKFVQQPLVAASSRRWPKRLNFTWPCASKICIKSMPGHQYSMPFYLFLQVPHLSFFGYSGETVTECLHSVLRRREANKGLFEKYPSLSPPANIIHLLWRTNFQFPHHCTYDCDMKNFVWVIVVVVDSVISASQCHRIGNMTVASLPVIAHLYLHFWHVWYRHNC